MLEEVYTISLSSIGVKVQVEDALMAICAGIHVRLPLSGKNKKLTVAEENESEIFEVT